MSGKERAIKRSLVWSAYTDIGPLRKENEDSFVIVSPATFVIADGMGGYAAGEIASRILTDTAAELLTGDENITELSLKHVITEANRKIIKEAVNSPEKQGMGTTATLCHIKENVVCWAHVGDSKLYHIHKDSIVQITKDHTYANLLVERGQVSFNEAYLDNSANMLTRAVGVEDVIFSDSGSFGVELGDKLILCTDGLSATLSENAIFELLHDASIESSAKKLVMAAIDCGTRDNVTAIVVEVLDHC